MPSGFRSRVATVRGRLAHEFDLSRPMDSQDLLDAESAMFGAPPRNTSSIASFDDVRGS